MITDREAALFSYLAYSPPEPNDIVPPDVWVPDDRFNSFDDPVSGYAVRVYTNSQSGETVVAFRGSAPLAATEPDWFPTNLALALGVGAVQLQQALETIAQLQSFNIDLSTVTFTGHSLGGGLASIAAVFFAQPAITFDGAPFELSARDDGFSINAASVAEYYDYYTAALSLLPRAPAPDPAFTQYRDAWQSSQVVGAELFYRREDQVADFYVTGDPVNHAGGSIVAPWVKPIADSQTELETGSQTIIVGSPVRHDMSLAAALVNSLELRTAFQRHSTLMEQMVDTGLYGAYWKDPSTTGFMVRLLRGAYSENIAEAGLILHFANDINRIQRDGLIDDQLQRGLIAAAIEYYNYAAPETADNLFIKTGGALRFDLRRLPSWDPPGAQGPSISDSRAGNGTATLIRMMPDDGLSFDEANQMRLKALDSEIWTVKTEAEGEMKCDGFY